MLDVGFAGEFRIVVSDKDGNIKQDTGYQKNLILNQGLDFFGGGKAYYFNDYCVVGSGNSTPVVTQTKLDVAVAIAGGSGAGSDSSYADKGDNLYRMWEQKKYRFEGLSNVNISEVGLSSSKINGDQYPTVTDYWLNTRALIKDSSGTPTTITVKTGEVLDIYYKIHKVVDTRDKEFVVDMLDGDGGSVPYNMTVRLAKVGLWVYPFCPIAFQTTGIIKPSKNELKPITVTEYPESRLDGTVVYSKYTRLELKRGLKVTIPLNLGNISGIRTMYVGENSTEYDTSWYPFQARFGSVADDSPIPKTANHTLEIPFEISWGRYEGAL